MWISPGATHFGAQSTSNACRTPEMTAAASRSMASSLRSRCSNALMASSSLSTLCPSRSTTPDLSFSFLLGHTGIRPHRPDLNPSNFVLSHHDILPHRPYRRQLSFRMPPGDT